MLGLGSTRQIERGSAWPCRAPLEGRTDVTGSSLTPFVVPIVGMVCLAALLAIVYYADSHPEWKHAGQQPGHGAVGPGHSTAVISGEGTGQLSGEPGQVAGEPGQVTGEPGHLAGEPGHVAGEPPSA